LGGNHGIQLRGAALRFFREPPTLAIGRGHLTGKGCVFGRRSRNATSAYPKGLYDTQVYSGLNGGIQCHGRRDRCDRRFPHLAEVLSPRRSSRRHHSGSRFCWWRLAGSPLAPTGRHARAPLGRWIDAAAVLVGSDAYAFLTQWAIGPSPFLSFQFACRGNWGRRRGVAAPRSGGPAGQTMGLGAARQKNNCRRTSFRRRRRGRWRISTFGRRSSVTRGAGLPTSKVYDAFRSDCRPEAVQKSAEPIFLNGCSRLCSGTAVRSLTSLVTGDVNLDRPRPLRIRGPHRLLSVRAVDLLDGSKQIQSLHPN